MPLCHSNPDSSRVNSLLSKTDLRNPENKFLDNIYK
jgi:hypothetical protein